MFACYVLLTSCTQVAQDVVNVSLTCKEFWQASLCFCTCCAASAAPDTYPMSQALWQVHRHAGPQGRSAGQAQQRLEPGARLESCLYVLGDSIVSPSKHPNHFTSCWHVRL